MVTDAIACLASNVMVSMIGSGRFQPDIRTSSLISSSSRADASGSGDFSVSSTSSRSELRVLARPVIGLRQALLMHCLQSLPSFSAHCIASNQLSIAKHDNISWSPANGYEISAFQCMIHWRFDSLTWIF